MDEILKNLSEGRVDVETAKKQLRLFALHNNEKACLDVGRACRKGVPEVVLAVVNIDNGFGAGVFAAMIVKKR